MQPHAWRLRNLTAYFALVAVMLIAYPAARLGSAAGERVPLRNDNLAPNTTASTAPLIARRELAAADPADVVDDWQTHVIDDAQPTRSVFICLADLNGDTYPDIASGAWWYENPHSAGGEWRRRVIGGEMDQVALLQSLTVPGNPAGGAWPIRTFTETTQSEQLSAGDVDRDGDLDIVLGTKWLANDGTAGEDIDALGIAVNGRLLISTSGAAHVVSLVAADEDLLLFDPANTGSDTAGLWSLYLDGSDVGLTAACEDLSGVGVGSDQALYLSAAGAFSVPGVAGNDHDVFHCRLLAVGETSQCDFSAGIQWDGARHGFSAEKIDGLDWR